MSLLIEEPLSRKTTGLIQTYGYGDVTRTALSEKFRREVDVRPVDLINHAFYVHRDDTGERIVAYPHHLEWARMLEDVENYRWLCLIAPPGYSKSTWVSLIYPSWRIGRTEGKIRIGLISKTARQATNFANSIRQTIESRDFYRYYPEVVPDERRGWSRDQMFSTNTPEGANPMLVASGIGGPIQGRRFDEIIVDDPVNWDNVRSEVVMDAIRYWFKSLLIQRFPPGKGPPHGSGRMIVVMCLAGDTRVPLHDGRWVEVRDIKVGDTVFAFDGESLVPRTVTGQRSSGLDETITIRTSSKAITANARHPILVLPEPLGNADRSRPRFDPEWKQAGDIRVGDLAVVVDELETGGHPPPVEGWDTPERLWFLGSMIGDGWVTIWQHKGDMEWCVCAALGVDEILNEKIAQAFEEAFGKRPRRCVKERYWRLDMRRAGREFDALGLHPGVRAPQKCVPEWVFGLSPELRRAFLRGLLDADGCKPKIGASHTLSSSSVDLVEGARLLAMMSGVRVGMTRTYNLRSQPPNSPHPIDYLSVSAIFTFPEEGRNRRGGALLLDPVPTGLRIERVRSVDKAGEQEVFDLSVDGEANFVAEGFVAHNTRWGENDLVPMLAELGFKIVTMPALGYWDRVDNGDGTFTWGNEPLWPAKDSAEDLLAKRQDDEIGFELVMQGNPLVLSGGMFNENWFQRGIPPAASEFDKIVQFVDTAGGKDRNRGDYFALATVGIIKAKDEVWILDMERHRGPAPDQERSVMKEYEEWSLAGHTPDAIVIEEVNEGTALYQRLIRTTRLPLQTYKPEKDKEWRAMPLSNAYRSKTVWHPVGERWVPAYEQELKAFGNRANVAHDDQVDAAAGAYNATTTRERIVKMLR